MLKGLLNLFIQSTCPLCQRQAKDIVCVYCQTKIKSHRLTNWEQKKKGNLPVFAWGQYEGELKRAIALLKYHNQPQLGVLLGRWLGQSWLNALQGSKMPQSIVIPIPLHQQKLKARGFNQSFKIAQGFCQVTGYSLQSQGLIRVRDTEAMFGLNPQRRQQNVKNAFVVNQNWHSKPLRSPVLLLDDIYTTGSTIQEAKKVLSQYRITISGVAVVATAQRKK